MIRNLIHFRTKLCNDKMFVGELIYKESYILRN